jgi:hypothetical protein
MEYSKRNSNQIDLTRTYKNIGGNAFLVPNRLLIETKR